MNEMIARSGSVEFQIPRAFTLQDAKNALEEMSAIGIPDNAEVEYVTINAMGFAKCSMRINWRIPDSPV